MIGLILALASVSLPAGADEKNQPAPPSIDPKFDIAPRRPLDRNSRFTFDKDEGRCYFIATRPVKPDPDKSIVQNIPSGPPIDNMPVVKPGPTCSSVR